jgi:hypothetical protein
MFYCKCERIAEVNIKTFACRDVTSCSSAADSYRIVRKPHGPNFTVPMLEAVDSSEPLVPTFQTTLHYITVN